MGKTFKIVVLGAKGTGKTAIIEQAIYGNHVVGTPMAPTIEDTYFASVLSEKSPESLRFYDTAGLDCQKPAIPKHYFSIADAYILVYDITSWDTFHCLNVIKTEVERHKEKKEAPVILVLGNKTDLESEARQIDTDTVQKWAVKEKVHFREVTVANKKSLTEALSWLTAKLTPAPQRSGLSIKNHFKKSAAVQASNLSAIGPAADV